MGNICTTTKRRLIDLWNIAMRKFPTKYHASKWPQVERLFCIRAMVVQTLYIFSWIMADFIEVCRPIRVQKLLDEGVIPND